MEIAEVVVRSVRYSLLKKRSTDLYFSYQNFSYLDTVEILHTILEKEDMEKTVLVGMSMGGYPSQHFAAIYPGMVSGLACVPQFDTMHPSMSLGANFNDRNVPVFEWM